MEIFSCYHPPEVISWTGRVDDPDDYNAYRWHQIIELIDISKEKIENLSKGSKGFCFLGFCCDIGVKRNLGRTGASKGPSSIRQEMSNLSCSFSRNTRLFDAGDIHCEDRDLPTAQEDLAKAVKKILSMGLIPIVLGGGHELAFGHYKGIIESLRGENLKKKNSKKLSLGIINFDAHFDLRPYGQESSSGSMFSQISDLCQERGIQFSYMCIGIQKHSNTMSLFKRADKLGVNYILAKDISDNTLPQIKQRMGSFLNKNEHIYLTICSDVISSAFAPGVSSPQPFGLQAETTLTLIKHVLGSRKVISFDIAEVSPRFDEDNRTAKLAAIIIYAVVNLLQ
jgi:formiminoglutamase